MLGHETPIASAERLLHLLAVATGESHLDIDRSDRSQGRAALESQASKRSLNFGRSFCAERRNQPCFRAARV